MTSTGRRVPCLGLGLVALILASPGGSPLAAGQSPFAEQRTELVASDGFENDYFGSAVAVDGDTIVIGAPGVSRNGVYGVGAVYVFVKPPGSGWTESAKLFGSTSNGRGTSFGLSVAVSGDVIVVGDPMTFRAGPDLQYSRAHVYVKPVGGWSGVLTETATLKARGARGDGGNGAAASQFGRAVAIDGDTIVVSGGRDGKAYVFQKPLTGWAGTVFEQARLSTSDDTPLTDHVAIDGRTIFVGGVEGPATGARSPAVCVYVRPLSGWHGDVTTPTAKLVSPNPPSPVSSFAFGAQGDTVALRDQGVVWVFLRPPGGWVDTHTESARLLTQRHNDIVSATFVGPLAVSGSGNRITANQEQHKSDGPEQPIFKWFYYKRASSTEPPFDNWFGLKRPTSLLFASQRSETSIAAQQTTTVFGDKGHPVANNTNQGWVLVTEH